MRKILALGEFPQHGNGAQNGKTPHLIAPDFTKATAKCTSPTGFSGVPPSGPAMPVMAAASVAGVLARTPLAMASAVSRLTAP
jgi:hypothetical protein